MNRRKSKVVVEVIDGEALFQFFPEEEKKKLPPGVTMKLHGSYGLVKIPHGTFVLDREGNRNSAPVEELPVELGLIRSDCPNSKPSWYFTVNEESVSKVPIKNQMTLDDFIRVFGARLETTFAQCEKFFTSTMP